jgi:hypothetical protein
MRHIVTTEAQPPPVLELGTEILQHGIGLFVGQLAHQSQGSWVAARLAASCMPPRCHLPCCAALPQQLHQERIADTEQGGQGLWGAKLLVVGTEAFLP